MRMMRPVKTPSSLELRSLRYVVAIVEEGSLALAARRLGVTQPALSRSVQALEEAFGVRLLDRGKAGAVATAAGRLLVERGRPLLAGLGALTRELELLAGAESGEVRIGAGTYPADISVGTAAARLLARTPGVQLRISVRAWPELIENVLSEELDVAICEIAHASRDARLVVEPLPAHPGVLFCRRGHPLAGRRRVSLEDVRKFPIAAVRLPSRLAALLDDGGNEAADRTLDPAVDVDTFQLARAIVFESDAIALATAAQIKADVDAGRLAVLPLHPAWLSTSYGILQLAGRTPSPATTAFLAEVRAVEAELAAAAPETTTSNGPRAARARAT